MLSVVQPSIRVPLVCIRAPDGLVPVRCRNGNDDTLAFCNGDMRDQLAVGTSDGTEEGDGCGFGGAVLWEDYVGT